MFDKLADKLLKQADKNKDLKKYNIDLSGLLGDIDNSELYHTECIKTIDKAEKVLNEQLKFWASKSEPNQSRLSILNREIKLVASVKDQVLKKQYPHDDLKRIKEILNKYGH